MKTLRTTLLSNKQGVSHAISAVIITTTIIALVLAASMYAYQVLEQHRATAEFECAKESILAFNDALENVAWKPQATRSVRFTVEYGELRLIPNANSLEVVANVAGTNYTLYSETASILSYYILDKYITYGSGYESYILGNQNAILIGSAGSYGRAVVKQNSGWVYVTLDYRVRAMLSSIINVTGNNVNYVDFWIIKPWIDASIPYAYIHDFDLKARCLRVRTANPSGVIEVVGDNVDAVFYVKVGTWNPKPPPSISLKPNFPEGDGKTRVVFNVIVAEVQVYV